MRWTQQEYEQYIAKSESARRAIVQVKRANSAGGVPSRAKPEQAVCNDALAEAPGTSQNTTRSLGRIKVSITSYRRRLIDPDNLCAKWFVDSLRYAGAIPDDREEDISLEVRQRQVESKTRERTEIEIA